MEKLKLKLLDLHARYNQNRTLAFVQAYILNTFAILASPFTALYNALQRKHYPVKPKASVTKIDLEQKYYRYLQLVKGAQDSFGFVETHECDSLLFTGLTSAGGAKVAITAARDDDGYWHRRPFTYPECWEKDSKKPGYKGSTISRDMTLGLFWHIWANKDLKVAEKLYQDGKKRAWIMGFGNISRIYLTPGLQATLAEMIYRMGGKNRFFVRNFFQSWPKTLEDYQLHLEMLHIELRGQVLGHIGPKMLEVIKDAKNREPNNALICALYAKYVTGDVTQAAAFLLNSTWWPQNRLPTSKDRKVQWLPQRRYFKIIDGKKVVNPDWKPSDEGHTHSGGDLLFVGKIILDFLSPRK